jgi:hypothetical protein
MKCRGRLKRFLSVLSEIRIAGGLIFPAKCGAGRPDERKPVSRPSFFAQISAFFTVDETPQKWYFIMV